ncbi:neutral/alkaline non-lysosomal ceramidase N-terminal domain-containing protein [Cyclobacterium plantarum]|uniref:Neutral/alkaline non-lysosomal ceramidase N-terminal domain-containing protein n=1 Tax=Cyclobacterium plantarum TaxID=2716263 RepID=A0ABX0H653_9BACT|nr:neutral/alkaline non-lysosomal ceramidase N-terminal domain-containing protein [Cyclobacterium plantarum]NHE57344.1 hypothetical protein [Cyclobacterium plantarum]
MKTWIKYTLFFLAFGLLLIFIYGSYQFRDRHKGYWLDLSIKNEQASGLQAGFAKIDISPVDFDTWTDANGDARFNEADGDQYQDLNANGKFDPIWMAGFHQNKPASGINDPLWARSMVLDDGKTKLGLCVIDMIGFGNDEVISLRKKLLEMTDLDHLIISSTHVHSSPDMMGMWGPGPFTRGVNKSYQQLVFDGIEKSVLAAYKSLKPAKVKFAVNERDAAHLVGDSREPMIYDAAIRIMQVQELETGKTLGMLLNWGNHPETLWAGNTLISADFPHYWRHYMEEGIHLKDSLVHQGLGGIAIFLNGALGGLMTTRPNDPVTDPITGEQISEASIQKIDAQGKSLAKISFETMKLGMDSISEGSIDLRAKTVKLPMANKLFRLAAFVGVFDRGFVEWGKVRSEVNAWTIGPASFVHVPGELYPEILNGGVESPDGGDFGIDPVEVPAIRSQMPGKYRFFSGMSNDMIGYIVPKSQWDENPPFTYGREKAPYGEINSLGPETAPILHRETLNILKELGTSLK